MGTTTPHFVPADDLLHDLAGYPHGRESLFWVLPLPAEGLVVLCYAWKTAATGKFGRFVVIAGDDGGRATYLGAADGVDLEGGTDLDDCVVAGLHIRQPEPLQVAELSYDDEGVRLELRYEGTHYPFSWAENENGCAAWAAADRYEQSCHVTGTLRFDGREIAVDTFGHRDHSWGTRDWRALQHWKWISGSAGPDLSVHAWTSFALGDNQVNGYVNRGGVVTPLVNVKAHAELDEEFMHTTLAAVLTDADGGTVTLELERRAIWKMPMRHLYLNEAAMAGTIDGRPADVHVELGWPQAYVDDLLDPDAAD